MDPEPRCQLLVVDDDARVRRAVALLLAGSRYAPTLVERGAEALALLDVVEPALVLVDLGLPDIDGVDLIAAIVARRPATPCLVLTVASTEARIRAALRAGARGYLLKEELGPRLLTAIEEGLHGGVPMSRDVADRVLAQVRDAPIAPSAQRPPLLTEREREVLILLARGLSYGECAQSLGVSIDTVRTHVRRSYEKLHASSKAEAVAVAMREGWLD